MFSLIPYDKSLHEVYGARIAAVIACVALFVVFIVMPGSGLHLQRFGALIAAIAALVSAAGAGAIKERMDQEANDAAAAAGLPAPHSVEKADIVATTLGGVVVALPLAVLWLLPK